MLEAESTSGQYLWLEELSQFEKFNDSIGNQNRDLLACSSSASTIYATAGPLVQLIKIIKTIIIM
jgi:hypothetical protein